MSYPIHVHVISKIVSFLQDEWGKLFDDSCMRSLYGFFPVVCHMSFQIYFVFRDGFKGGPCGPGPRAPTFLGPPQNQYWLGFI